MTDRDEPLPPIEVPAEKQASAVYRCLDCGEVFNDRWSTGVRTMAPAECPRCGEEQMIELVSPPASEEPQA